MVESSIANYSIIRELGSGQYSAVYLAEEDKDHAPVALKQAGQTHLENERSVLARLTQERIKGIPNLLGTTEMSGRQYLVLEYIEGKCLQDVRKLSMPLPVVLKLIAEFFNIMARLHTMQIVHDDLHEANILVGKDRGVYVIDFGFAYTPTSQAAYKDEVFDMINMANWFMALATVEEAERAVRHALLDWLEHARQQVKRGGCWEAENATFIHSAWLTYVRQVTIKTPLG